MYRPIRLFTNLLFRLFSLPWILKCSPPKTRKRERCPKVHFYVELLRRFSDIQFPSALSTTGLTGGDEPSANMWTLNISHAAKHDAAMVDRWKSDMDGILIYVRLKMAQTFGTPVTFLTTLSRRAYSLRRLPRSSLKATSISSLIHLKYLPGFFNKSRRNSPGSPTEHDSPLRLLKHFGLNVMLFM